MSKRDAKYCPKSLAHHFEAPDGYAGLFGWICGYSADSGFLDDAVERFLRRTHAQRAYEGRIGLAVMLDPSNPQISASEVPGVLHLPLSVSTPFKLQHAKVAILGFRHEADPNDWTLRLIVSTGNWTRETLERSLDLVLCIDLRSSELNTEREEHRQACADLIASWDLIEWMLELYDTRALYSTRPGRQESVTEMATRVVTTWLAKIKKLRGLPTARFFDNRNRALFDSLLSMIDQHAGSSARNYLAMGSGFYESSDDPDQVPSVLSKIVDLLKTNGVLTKHAEIDVFVNPQNCQAVAASANSIARANWNIRAAAVPDFYRTSSRSLHAKFLFSASESTNSDFCNSPWVYLGSGNLTNPGFANRMNPSSGNLEAGVLFRPHQIRWRANKTDQNELVTNFLPLQWDSDFNSQLDALDGGSEMPEPEVNFAPAPIGFFFWCADGDNGWLKVENVSAKQVDVIDQSGIPCEFDPRLGYRWTGAMPREVQVRWIEKEIEFASFVPVIDEYGRIAATALREIDLSEAWNQLENFPMPPDDEDIRDHDVVSLEKSSDGGLSSAGEANYSVRQMMQLIENISNKQVMVRKDDWSMWCTRLEQCLVQASESKVLKEFLILQLNPLSPLKHPPFRPDYAISPETAEGCLYDTVLKRIESAWNVASLNEIGTA
jgi:hypothetical protein